MGEMEVESIILQRYPELGLCHDSVGYLLWNHTCFPFPHYYYVKGKGNIDDSLEHWMNQIREVISTSMEAFDVRAEKEGEFG